MQKRTYPSACGRTSAQRSGLLADRVYAGKLRHVECHSLRLQQRLRRKEFELEIPAVLFTKDLESSKNLDQLLRLFNCSIVSGCAESAPGLNTAKGADDGIGISLVDVQILHHQLPMAEMNRRHTVAVPDDERYGEADQTPQSELRDPFFPNFMGASERPARQRRKRVPKSSRGDVVDRQLLCASALQTDAVQQPRIGVGSRRRQPGAYDDNYALATLAVCKDAFAACGDAYAACVDGRQGRDHGQVAGTGVRLEIHDEARAVGGVLSLQLIERR